VAETLGHTDIRMNKRYSHAMQERKRSALEKLVTFGSSRQPDAKSGSGTFWLLGSPLIWIFLSLFSVFSLVGYFYIYRTRPQLSRRVFVINKAIGIDIFSPIFILISNSVKES